jgi:hypothetical protein
MRIGEWNCDEQCVGCEKENEPAWCILAISQITKQVLEELQKDGYPV